jgi:hypothetical protein
MLCNQVLPNAKADEIRGPFTLAAYLLPPLAFGMPAIVFTALTSFAVGLRWRKPILVFVLPVAMILACSFFLWQWAPTWLSPFWNKVLMAVDPSGFRWLNETHLKLDRGVEYYNKAAIGFDAVYVWSRLALLALGFGAFHLAVARFARTMRGELSLAAKKRLVIEGGAEAPAPLAAVDTTPPLGELAMRGGAPGFWRGAIEVARVELRELRNAPGLYLFIPLILLQTLGSTAVALGPFGTFVLATPGGISVRMMNTLSMLVA